jgi:hypothetical protein
MAQDLHLRCSFCGKGKDEVKRFITGPSVYICNECVELSVSLLKEDEMKEAGINKSSLPKEGEAEHTTPLGTFRKDASGLWHYEFYSHGHIERAAQDAVSNRPPGVCWFWFNRTFSPIFQDDNFTSLLERYNIWRDSYQENPRLFLSHIGSLFPNRD